MYHSNSKSIMFLAPRVMFMRHRFPTSSETLIDVTSAPLSTSSMSTFVVLLVILVTFTILVLVFFALSSCLGDEIRALWSGQDRYMPTTYGLQYARSMANHSSQGGWEQIEMAEMLNSESSRRFED